MMVTISTSPISPASIAARTAMKCGSKRRLKPTIRMVLLSATTLRHSSTRLTLRSIGFSQKIALPALLNFSIRSAWVSVGVQITTASMSARLKDLRRCVRTSQPYWLAISSAAFGIASATATSLASGIGGHGLGVNLADTSRAEQGEADGHDAVSLADPDRPRRPAWQEHRVRFFVNRNARSRGISRSFSASCGRRRARAGRSQTTAP